MENCKFKSHVKKARESQPFSNKGFDEDVKIPWPVARKGPKREIWS